MFETIQYELDCHTARIVLNRPQALNAFTADMNREIAEAVRLASRDEQVRCLMITGAGRAFSSGQDLSQVDETMDHGQVLRDHYGPMVKELMNCQKPIVAAVNGVAAGAGFSLALACDFRLLSERGSFLNAFINVGLIPDSGNLYYLNKLVGPAKALEMSVLGEKIYAEEALRLGLATKVIAEEAWQEETKAFCDRMAFLPTKAIGLIKRSLKMADSLGLEDYLSMEAEAQRIAGKTVDHQEGVAAFMAKRKAVWIGK
ncbi:enoyl-CoA hydratase-related protein [Bacillus testis]|uniref:enoyl-CoA hydratase-related protein n=1 Tax=Bacillus testis TaxID=1622072 RepID=UPI00067EC357|nr:enoyl-CoA hydratase-related protein [Bacillus testis]